MDRPPLILAPTSAGMPGVPGLRLGPQRIVEALRRLEGIDGGSHWDARPLCLGHDAVADVRVVAEAVAPVVGAGTVSLVAGGDHTVAAGSIVGVRRGLRLRHGRDVPLYVLWLDAHPDANTPDTSPSGNLHGMVLAGLLGAGPLAIAQPLPPHRVVLAGTRAVDPGERAFLAARPGLRRWGPAALRGNGWRPVFAALLAEIERAAGRLYVTVDLDVVDPSVAPGVAAPAPGGARPEVVLALLERAAQSGLLAGADVAELYPAADIDGCAAALAAQAFRALAGQTRPAQPTWPLTTPNG